MGEKIHRMLEERQGSIIYGEEIVGYAINGAWGARYRMTERSDRIEERELRGALQPEFPWGDIVILAVVDSTNRLAMEMGEHGAPHGTIVVAEEQTADRGQMDRRWSFEPKGGRTVDVIYSFVFLLPK